MAAAGAVVHLQDPIHIGTSAAFGHVMTLPRLPDLIPYDPPFTMWLPQFVG